MIIGIAGRLGAGKTTVAKVLEEKGFVKISFAAKLKEMVSELYEFDITSLNDPVLKNMQLENPLIWNKEVATKLKKLAGIPVDDLVYPFTTQLYSRREALQFIGTEVLRGYDRNYHIRSTLHGLDPKNDYYLDDVRFEDEVAAIRIREGECLFVIRPSNFNLSEHSSETSLRWANFLHHYINDTPLEKAKPKIESILNGVIKKIPSREITRFEGDRTAFYDGFLEDAGAVSLAYARALGHFESDGNACKFIIQTDDQDIVEDLTGYCQLPKTQNGLDISNPFILENLKDHLKSKFIKLPGRLISK